MYPPEFTELVAEDRRLNDRLDANSVEVKALKHQITELSVALNTNASQAKEIIELYASIKIFLVMLVAMEKAAVWVTKIGAAGVIVWGVWKFIISETLMNIKLPK